MAKDRSKIGVSKQVTGQSVTTQTNLPDDWADYAREVIKDFTAGIEMTLPTPKGNMTISIAGPGMFQTVNEKGTFEYDGMVKDADGKVVFQGTMTLPRLRKRFRSALGV